jgi:diguanylate cyclase (GGDEF)-like protein
LKGASERQRGRRCDSVAMGITFLIGLSVLLQFGTVTLCLRMYLRYGRRPAWLFVFLNCLVWLIRTGLSFQNTSEHHAPPPDLALLLLGSVSALLLLTGLTLMDGVYKANAQTVEEMRQEKRRLSMLVDRRVADLEVEVAERQRAEDALRQEGERFAAVIATQQEIATSDLGLNAIMTLIATRCQTLTGADGAALRLIEDGEVVFRAVSGRAEPNLGTRSKITDGISGECIRIGKPLRCNDSETDPHVNLESSRREGTRSTVVVPLHHERRIVGVLQIMSPERYAFSAMDVHTLQLMTGLITAAMSHAAEYAAKQTMLAEAIERAERDPLTGLLNHRAFHKRLEEAAEQAQQNGTTLAVAVMDLDNFKFFNDSYGHITGDDVLRRVATALGAACGPDDVLARFGGDEFAILSPGIALEEGPRLAAHLSAALGDVGYQPPGYDVAVPMSLSAGVAVFPQEGATRMDVVELADARLRRAKTGAGDNDQADRLRDRLSNALEGFSMLDALVTAVDNKDRYTHRHCEDVLAYCLQIAAEVELDQETQDTIAVAALLHDVGKIGVPDSILRKPGRLTEEEFAAVQQHPVMGAVIVSAVPGLEATLDAIRHHHERWDGGGYPYGLRGLEIPLIARLMAVADAFSAMTTDRPYRKGMAQERALGVLEAGAGIQWDPEFVTAFLSHRRRLASDSPPPALTLVCADIIDPHSKSALPLAA